MVEIVEPAPRNSFGSWQHLWVDEQIWGHRLYDDQSPWLILLEFLSVAEACHSEGRLLEAGVSPHQLHFRPEKRLHLRNILFNNEMIARIAQRSGDDDAAWREWTKWMRENAQGVADADFSYLQSRFRSFGQFASLVAMVRSTTIESGSNRRWSSRFIFPFGRNAIYEDLSVKQDKVSREYINFGRTGEILYQMLARSADASALRVHLARLLDNSDPCDRLLEMMQKADTGQRETRGGSSFLPYVRHPSFDDLAGDWLSVLEQAMPRFDAYPHLATLSAFHLSAYLLKVAADVCGRGRPHYVCEVVAPRKSLVRELSIANYIENNQLPLTAVETHVRDIGQREDWLEASSDPEAFSTCLEILRRQVNWPIAEGDYEGPMEAEVLIGTLRRRASERHRQHVANVHRSFGGGAGLVSKRGTNRLRYAPTDDLLRSLIFANVTTRMEYGEFLALLFERYGLVLGEREAKLVLGPDEFDKRAFQANSERLEGRLKTLGMLRRLSDACAYVENPLRKAAAA